MSDDENANNNNNLMMTDADLESVDMGDENLLAAGDDASSNESRSSHTGDPTAATTGTTAAETPTTTTPPAIGLQPVGSERSHEQYVSLDISRDSDENKKKSVYHKTTKVRKRRRKMRLLVEKWILKMSVGRLHTPQQLAKAYAAIMKEEEAFTRTMADMRLQGPMPESGVRDIEQALIGDYEGHYHDEKGSLFRMPEATYFEQRLENSKFDNMNMDSTARRYRFLVPFIIKAELNPGLAFAEGILTWVHLLSRKCHTLLRKLLPCPYVVACSD